MKYSLYLILIIFFFVSCKKEKYIPISDSMKEYFAYQKGSYWIYKNDSTGIIDCTYVNNLNHVYDFKDYYGTKMEFICMDFTGNFLSESVIQYLKCAGPDYFTIASILHPDQHGVIESGGAVAYFGGWPQNEKIISPACEPGGVFLSKTIPNDTVNNISYNNIIYSEFQTIDSTSTNLHYYLRKIYFAKNIGIIKYFESAKYFNIHRSYSLLRYKVVQ